MQISNKIIKKKNVFYEYGFEYQFENWDNCWEFCESGKCKHEFSTSTGVLEIWNGVARKKPFFVLFFYQYPLMFEMV